MGFLKNIFSKKKEEVENVGGMEDFMTLIRVYLQAEIAGNLGPAHSKPNKGWTSEARLFEPALHRTDEG